MRPEHWKWGLLAGAALGLAGLLLFGARRVTGRALGESQIFGATVQAIVGGEASALGSFEAVGALVLVTRERGSTFCTGTLIEQSVVLTAAHCVSELETDSTVYFSLERELDIIGHTRDESGYIVTPFGPDAGELGERLTVRVGSWTIHPGFGWDRMTANGLGQANDLALLWLDERLNVEPARLPNAETMARFFEGTDEMLWIVGYGKKSESDGRPGLKHEARTVINEVGPYEVQVGRQPPVPQKCNGDSGGPSFMILSDEHKETPHLVGVTSRAHDSEANCDVGGVDTRVDRHLKWVAEEVKFNLQDDLSAEILARLDSAVASTARGLKVGGGLTNDGLDQPTGCGGGPPGEAGTAALCLVWFRRRRS